MSDMNDEFAQFATDYAAENENKPRGTFTSPEYEEIKWTGLEPKSMKVIRALGNIPDKPTNSNTDAKSVQIAWIKGDDGKMFRSILPPKDSGEDHLMWRIISRVKEKAYVNRKSVFVNDIKHKEIFDMVAFNGLTEGDPQRRFNKGWEGKHALIMNVIDREQMAWHKENKHTMLLSRNVGMSKDGSREFAEEGVSLYGFYNLIVSNCFSNYGDWNNYDIGVTRTGEMSNPYKICNASAYVKGGIPEVPASLAPLVSLDPLTEEEAEWERYDISKLFKVTSYTKYYNKLKVAIQTIDARLGTKFFDELKDEMEKEKAARELANAEKAANEADVVPSDNPALGTVVPETGIAVNETPITEAVEPAPTRTRAPAPAPVANTVPGIELLRGYDLLTPEQQASITGIEVNGQGQVVAITTTDPSPMVACPDCSVPSPESFDVGCPNCGLTWS